MPHTSLGSSVGRWKPLRPALGHSNQGANYKGWPRPPQPLLCLPAKVCSLAFPSALRPDQEEKQERKGPAPLESPRETEARGPQPGSTPAKVLTGCLCTSRLSSVGDLREARGEGKGREYLLPGTLPLGEQCHHLLLSLSSPGLLPLDPSSILSTSQKLHPRMLVALRCPLTAGSGAQAQPSWWRWVKEEKSLLVPFPPDLGMEASESAAGLES